MLVHGAVCGACRGRTFRTVPSANGFSTIRHRPPIERSITQPFLGVFSEPSVSNTSTRLPLRRGAERRSGSNCFVTIAVVNLVRPSSLTGVAGGADRETNQRRPTRNARMATSTPMTGMVHG